MPHWYRSAVEIANAAKQRRCELWTATDSYARAYRRVHRSPSLSKYSDIILADAWSNMDEHLRWVLTARVGEIADWAAELSEGGE